MSNSNFNSVVPTQTPLDPSKRVKYTMGLVLGVEEFEQEQYYLMERDRLHHRALHGYGTAVGLKVELKMENDVPKVMVSPGIAVNPRGDTVCVPESQCANLDDWLKENTAVVDAQLGEDVSGTASLYVVLCYKECLTDNVPIPGAPCRTKEDVLAPSRIADYFDLSITGTPPEQVEEDYVRCFGKFLRRIEISKYAPNPMNLDKMLEKVRELFGTMDSPPECPFDDEEFPSEDDKYYISPDNSAEILETVFRVWVTEIRPFLLRKAGVCGNVTGSPEASGLCVLLAQLDVAVKKTGGAWKFDGGVTGDEVIEDRRPILLHTRLLQEWLLFGGYEAVKPDAHTFASLNAKLPDEIFAWVHHRTLLDLQAGYIKVEINGVNISPFNITNFPNTNVISINLPAPLEEKSAVKVGFDVSQITLTGGPDSGKTLAEVLHKLDYIYLDRDGDWLWSYTIVIIPKLDDLLDVNVPTPNDDQILTWDSESEKWIATDKPVVITDHGGLSGLGDDDHQQYFNLARGDARYSRVNHTHPPADHGTLTGLGDDDHQQYHNNARANIWGDARYSLLNHNHRLNNLSDVNPTGLAGGHVLQWNTGQNRWLPGPIPSSGLTLKEIAALLPVLPFATIKDLGMAIEKEGVFLFFQIWFHLNTADQPAPRLNAVDMKVYSEDLDKQVCPVNELNYENLTPVEGKCNVYNITLNVTDIVNAGSNEIYLRFVFNLDQSTYRQGRKTITLTEWLNNMPLKWVGHDGKNTVTVFHHTRKAEILQNQYDLAAAGQFEIDVKNRVIIAKGPTINDLRAEFDLESMRVFLNFKGYNIESNYIVSGLPVIGKNQTWALPFLVSEIGEKGIVLQFNRSVTLLPAGFMVEIKEIINYQRG